MKNECRYYKREVYKYWCKMQSSFDSNQLIIPVIWPSSTSFPLATVINYFPDRRRCEATGSSLVRIFRKVASAYEKGLLAPKTSKDEDDVITSGLRPPSPTRVDHADELKDADEIFTSGLRPPSPTKVDQFENITRKSKSNGSQEKGSSGLRPPSPTKVDHAENLNQNPKSDSGLEGYSSPKHKKTSSLFGMFRGLATAFKKGILSPRKGGRNGSKILSDTKAPPSSRYGNVTIPSIASPTEIETSPKIETAPSNRPANIATLNVTNPPTQFEEKNLKDKKSASQITTEDDDLDDTWSEDRLRNALKAAAQLRNQNRESITLRNSITNFLSDGAGFLDTVLLGKSDEEVDDLNATMDSICSAGLSGTLSSIGSKKKSLAALALEQGDTGENKGDKENEHDSRNCGIRFSVWAHSMGNWLLYNLVTELLEKELQHEVCRFKKLIMTAPNVPPNMLDGHSIHYKKAGRKLCGIFDSIYSVYSLRDPALLINPHKNQNMGLKGDKMRYKSSASVSNCDNNHMLIVRPFCVIRSY